jgi:hypothetical protein
VDTDVSEAHAASIFRVKGRRISTYLTLYREAGRKMII